MARRLETTVAAGVRQACGMLADRLGIALAVAVILPEGPLAAEVEAPITATLQAEGLVVKRVAEVPEDAGESATDMPSRMILLVAE